MSNDWAFINKATGEIRDMQSKQAQDAGYRQLKAKQSREGRALEFTNTDMRHLHEVYSVLTTAQCGYLMLLQCYVNYDTGVIVDAKKHAMSTADMRNVLQLTGGKESTFYDFLGACLDNGILTHADGEYAVNKRYHFKGSLNNTFAVKSYTTKIKRVYREVKAVDIGLIYRMLPYVHMSTNALCDNPFERDPLKVRWLNRKELAEAIGVAPETLGRRLPKMTFDGVFVVARIKVGKEPERYTMNPSVFYRQDKAPEETLLQMFNVGTA